MRHPSRSDLESFLRGAASGEVAREAVRHLLAACPECRSLLDVMGWGREQLERLVSLVSADPEAFPAADESSPYDYDQAFESAWAVCWDNRSIARLAAAKQEESLETQRADDLPMEFEDLVPDPRVVRALLDRSHAARYQEPQKMLHWARLARNLAERCVSDTAGGAAALSDLRAQAWGQLGNALRVSGRLREAQSALERAKSYAATGSGAEGLRIRLWQWIAALRTFQRQFGEAITLLAEAAELSVQLGDRVELANCLVNRAIPTVYSGDAEGAIRLLNQALPLIDPRDRRLLFAAYHNLIYSYIEAGRLQEALALFPQTENLGEEIQDKLLSVRLRWHEAKILCELGMLEEAEAQFSRARDGFLERDLAYEAAIVSLDLTAVYVKLGMTAEVRRTIADILPIFSSLRVDREVLASLIQLQQAEDQTKALQLIRTLSRELVAAPKLPSSV